MDKATKHILFRKKFLGELSTEEEKQFTERSAADSNFEQEYQEYKKLSEVVILAENNSLKERLNGLKESSPKGTVLKLWPTIAASLILLIGISSFLYFSSKKDLYQEYFDTYPNVIMPTTRSDQNIENALQKAFFHYDRAQYTEASNGFGEYLKNQDDVNIRFYQAMSFMNNGQLNRAKDILETLVVQNETSDYTEETLWYLALIHLRNGDNNEAIKYLNTAKLREPGFKAIEIEELLLILRK